jgi:hypothetical protein
MIETSAEYQASLTGLYQDVDSHIVAIWANSRVLSGINAYSSSDSYYKTTLKLRPVIFWKLNDQVDWPIIEDFSGNGNHGIINGTLLFRDDALVTSESTDSASIRILGSDDANIFKAQESTLEPGINDFCMEVWFDFHNAGQNGDPDLPFSSSQYCIVSKAAATGNTHRSYEIVVDNNIIKANIYTGSTKNTVSTGVTIDKSTAYYACVFMINQRIYFRLNNTLYGPTTITSAINAAGDLRIGMLGDSTAEKIPVVNVEAFAFYNSTENSKILNNISSLTRYLSGRNTGEYAYTKNYFDATEAANGREEHSFLWAALDSKDKRGKTITANGLYAATEVDSANKHMEYGWWSKEISNGSGIFVRPEYLLLEFDQRKANYIDVLTAIDYGGIKTYDLYYKDSSDIWQEIDINIVMSNLENRKRHSISSGNIPIDIKGIYIVVKSTWNGFDVARVQELAPILEETIIDDEVVNFDVNKIKENFDSTLPIGITAANQCNLTFNNTDKKYNKFNITSPLYGYLEPEVSFEVKLRHRIAAAPTAESVPYGEGLYGEGPYGTGGESEALVGSDSYGDESYGSGTYGDFGSSGGGSATTVEIIPLGVFTADTLNTDTSGMTTTFQCRDKSKHLQDLTIEKGLMYQDTTISRAIGNLVRYGGIHNSKINIQERYIDSIYKLNPILHWRLNEASTSTTAALLTDRSIGSSHDTEEIINPIDGGVRYKPELDSKNEFSIEFWIKSIDADNGTIFFMREDETFNTAVLIQNTANLRFVIGSYDSGPTGVDINDDMWHHFALTLDLANKQLTVYVDGTVNFTSSSNALKPFSTLKMSEWNFGDAAGGSSFFISEMRIWAKELSQTEIKTNMNIKLLGHEDKLTSCWSLYEQPGNTNATEFLASSTHPAFWLANVVGDPGDTIPIFKTYIHHFKDSCISQDLMDIDEVATLAQPGPLTNDADNMSVLINESEIRGHNNLTISILDEFTFMGYVKFNTLNSSNYILSGGSTTGAFKLFVDATGALTCTIQGEGSVTSSSLIDINTWYHITAIVNKNDSNNVISINLYIDGGLVATIINNSSLYNSALMFPTTFSIGSDGGANHIDGYISEFTFFDYSLASTDLEELVLAGRAEKQIKRDFLWTSNQTVWDAMLEMATAEMGMFYFDEFDVFNYEIGSRMYDESYPRHSIVQWTLNDTDYIQGGSENVELLANKVTCKVNPVTEAGVTDVLWRAPSNESLAVTQLQNPVDKYTSTIAYKTIESGTTAENIYTPVFPETGYFKLENEIIKYGSRDKSNFYECERAQFNTPLETHPPLIPLYETRVYNIVYNSQPVLAVNRPFITAERENLANIDVWVTDGFGAQLILSAVDEDSSPHYVLLEGTDPLNELDWAFSISGVIVKESDADQTLDTVTTEVADSIRRYQLKTLDIDNKYITTQQQAKEIIDFILAHFSNQSSIISVNTMGLPHLQLSDKIRIGTFDQMDINNKDFWIIESNISYDGGIAQTMTLREVI